MPKSKVQINAKIQNSKGENGKSARNRTPNKQANKEKIYDLEERTTVFGERIIDFVKTLPDNVINRELIR